MASTDAGQPLPVGTSPGAAPSPAEPYTAALADLETCRRELGLDDAKLLKIAAIHDRLEPRLGEALAPVYRYVGKVLTAAVPNDRTWVRETSARLRDFLAQITSARLDRADVRRYLAMWRAVDARASVILFAPALFRRYDRALMNFKARCAGAARPWDDRTDAVLRDLAAFHLALVGTASFAHQLHAFQQRLMFDEPTQMPNSAKLVQRVRERVARAEAADTEENLALIKVELRFPDREDIGGGKASLDSTMNQFGERLKRMLRPNDVVGRTGRREFTLILGALRGEGHAMLAGQRVVQILRKPLVIGGKTIVAHTTVGIVIHPGHGRDAEVLLDNLTMAVDAARTDADGVALYSEAHASEDATQRSLEHELRIALYGNELMLYYHPQVDLRSGRIVGAEGLVRWVDRHGKWISPSDIVRAAETGGMMTELTSWAINSAMRQWSTLKRAGIDTPVSVNLAASDLQDSEFYPALDQALQTWDMPPDRLMLEITEGSMIQNVDHILSLLHRIRERGIQLAIDDFGTGYSSLAYLRKMPISELKIDQSFVRNMLRDKGAARIVRTVIDLAHNLDMHTVAEGVEDVETVQALRELNCDRIQGYYLTKPIPLDEYARWGGGWTADRLGTSQAPSGASGD